MGTGKWASNQHSAGRTQWLSICLGSEQLNQSMALWVPHGLCDRGGTVCVCAERGGGGVEVAAPEWFLSDTNQQLNWWAWNWFKRPGAPPPRHLLPGWLQSRATLTGISVIIPLGDGGEEQVRGWAGRDGSNHNTSLPGEVQFIDFSPAWASLTAAAEQVCRHCRVLIQWAKTQSANWLNKWLNASPQILSLYFSNFLIFYSINN